jgi:dipeptidyl aminopeptidase/acylaminoacyl peptidase
MRRALVAFVFLAAVGRLSAAPPIVATHDIVPADYAQVKLITEFALAPDGKQVAYSLSFWDEKADSRAADLWVLDTDGRGTPRQLTTDHARYQNPKWSADGKALFVLATRGEKEKAKQQVWKVPLDGKPEAMTDVKDGVIAFDYAPKADTLFYTVDATTTDLDEFTELRKKYDKIEHGHGKRTVSELFELRVGGKPAKLIAEKRYIREFAATADGKRIAMVSALDDSVVRSEGESRVDVWERKGGVATPPTDVYRAKAASPYAWLESLAWNPEGTRYAFCAAFDGYPAEIIVGEWTDGKWQTSRLERPKGIHVRGYGCPLKWAANDTLVGLGEQGGNVGLLTYSGVLDMGTATIVPNQVVYGMDFAPGTKSSVVLRSVPDGFPELFAGLTKLTDLNPITIKWRMPSIEHVTWKAPDGATVGGPLELPFGYDGKRRLPLVVAIHGGPTTASYNDLRFDPHNGHLYFAAKGYAVLSPNYRGSTGYGDKFLTDLIGNENDLDVKDIVAGIQHLIKVGIADPDRIAVMGWSNGGYLTNCLITMKDPPVKIRAASSGAGILDTVAEWGFNDEPAYPLVFKKGLPWEQPDLYRKTSPTYGIGNVTTPTLIHVGGNDDRCPPGHSRMLYRALKEYKKVPTELNVYPGQPHGLGKLSFRTAKMEWDLAWFDKYLKK